MRPEWSKYKPELDAAIQAIGLTTRYVQDGDGPLDIDASDESSIEMLDLGLILYWSAEQPEWVHIHGVVVIPGVRYYPDGSGEPDDIDYEELGAFKAEAISDIARFVALKSAEQAIDASLEALDIERMYAEQQQAEELELRESEEQDRHERQEPSPGP